MEREDAESLKQETKRSWVPEYLSLTASDVIQQGGATGGSEGNDILQIVEPAQSEARIRVTYVRGGGTPSPTSFEQKALEACIDPNAKADAERGFCGNAEEVSYGIRGEPRVGYQWM